MMPLVSVIIPTYNQAGYLQEALESVQDQTIPDWEAIVVDNHSDDGTEAVVTNFADPRIAYVKFRNNGIIAASRNRGVALARAPWIAFLDSDDYWHAAKLERCLAAVKADPGLAVLGHALWMKRNGVVLRKVLSGPAERATWRSLLFDGSCATPSASLVSAEWLRKVGGLSENPAFRTAEDWEGWLRLAEAGGRFAFIPDVLTDYRVHATSASASVETHMRASLAVVEEHYSHITRPGLRDGVARRARRAAIIRGAGRRCAAAGALGQALGWFIRSLAELPTPRTLAALLVAPWQALKRRD